MDRQILNLEDLIMNQFFDVTGKMVKADAEGKTELDISSLNQGLYIVKIQTIEGNQLFKKFLKK